MISREPSARAGVSGWAGLEEALDVGGVGGQGDRVRGGQRTVAGQCPRRPGARTDLYDVTTGSDGSCNKILWCNAGTGYDGPTGWGTPNGTGAFTG